MRAKPEEHDYLQYPYQTFAYRGGDSDDLAVLYASELESVGIAAALLPLDGEVLVAFRLKGDEATTRGSFSEAGDFIFVDGQAWLPVRVSMIREGFLRAWSEGARLLKADTDGRNRFFSLEEAWKRFPPAGVPGISGVTAKPSEERLHAAFDNALSLVVAKEAGPRADRMRAAFGPSGGTGRQRNSLGVLFARYGMYAEAHEEFKAAEDLRFLGAKVNLGNVAFLLGRYDEAASWFERALAERPDDVAALIGLARSFYELDRYEEADALFRKSTALMPALAERYGYLSARLSGTGARASTSADRGGGMVWDE
jgi:tetratricopeptide (TPR) repeat protein